MSTPPNIFPLMLGFVYASNLCITGYSENTTKKGVPKSYTFGTPSFVRFILLNLDRLLIYEILVYKMSDCLGRRLVL
ncbi:MAG: hypothetical protein K0Q87_2063 [Neobacillus sp.]|nr:hypothetical protein [Neobacillus sp.]